MNGISNNYYLLALLITTIISKTITREETFLIILFTSDWHFPTFPVIFTSMFFLHTVPEVSQDYYLRDQGGEAVKP